MKVLYAWLFVALLDTTPSKGIAIRIYCNAELLQVIECLSLHCVHFDRLASLTGS